MHLATQIIFFLLLALAATGMYMSISRIRKNILLGRDINRKDNPLARFKNMTLVALGQKKMFKKPVPAILHLFIYIGFLIVNMEMLEIVLDGLLGTHRIFAPILGNFYPVMINVFEFFAVSVIVACVVFLIRRNIIHVKRFNGEEMKKWPRLDANLILTIEILLMIAFLTMNAADHLLQPVNDHYVATGFFLISGVLSPLLPVSNPEALVIIERVCWWFHIIGVMFFANYVFYNSKHLHIFMAFLNTYFARLTPAGKLTNMPEVTKEVKLMLNLPVEGTGAAADTPGRFGAKDITDLTWKNLLDAYSCTECGRCTQQCPANITGKKLSPRKIMMDTRDRMEEVGENIRSKGKDFSDGKSLLGNYITDEEILACTTCNACVEACPVNIDPLDIIIQLRRFRLMEESQAPASWNAMLSNLENNFAPWKFSPADRFNWADKLKQ